jgi:Ca-activated chloride channel family protein
MSRFQPIGLQRCCARIVPVLLLGGLCLTLTACGAGSSITKSTKGGANGMAQAAAPEVPADPAKGQEAYATIIENPFRAVAVAPLSTFSADVNTASYSNVRRFINDGHLPPRDAVFLAELVNYFPYRYPNPTGDAPASLTLDLAPCTWKPEHFLARIGVRARSIDPAEAPRCNFVFLIDTSGSMQDARKLPLVKQSLELLVQNLGSDDRLSIVTYAGQVGVKLYPTPGDQHVRILRAVRSLNANGSTNGAGGIQKAYELARSSFIPGGVNRVILCTDGDFNVGITSPSELDQLIERERNSQVFLTALGYGIGNLKNNILESLANKGNGHYAYIDSIEEARKVFVEQGGALAVVARDVKFQVEFNPKRVTAYRLLGYENRLLANEDFKDDAKDAGDMGSGHTVTALYEIVPAGVAIDLPGIDPLKYQKPGKPAGPADEWLTVKMRYKEPTGETSKELAAVLAAEAAARTMSEDFAFAAAIAEWGLVLRNSEYRGSATLQSAFQRATSAAGYDPNGRRAEFLELVRRTIELRGQER